MTNFVSRGTKFLTAVLLASVSSGVVEIGPVNAVPIARGLAAFTEMNEKANSPKGWEAFCGRYADECQGDAVAPRKIELTDEKGNAVVRANKWVNDNINPMTDRGHWGTINKWVYPDDGYGDCKAYTLLKRRLLTEVGFPHEALLITVVWTKQNQGHAVLIVRTDKGDYVLDNLTPNVLLWTQTTHDYAKRQPPSNPTEWGFIDGYRDTEPATVASGN
jgi:predicted transglutaminase-like cysteine proteinase